MTVLADVLDFRGVPERISAPARERFVKLRLKGGGAVERKIGAGKTPVPFTGYRVRAGQFIYSRIDARNGAFATVPLELDGAVVSKDFPVFDIREDRVCGQYLRHFFLSGQLEQQIQIRSRGATNRQRIKEDEFLQFPIPLPPLDEQRRIAAILNQVDALRAKRRQSLILLDDLTRSVFRGMFGAPRASRTDEVALGELGEWRSGGTPPRGRTDYFNGELPWFSSGELGDLYVSSSKERITPEAIAETSVKAVPAGSILVGMYDTAALKSSITTVHASCNQAVAFSRVDPVLADGVFIYYAIQEARERVLTLRRGIRQKNLNLTMVREISIPCPARASQQEFAARVRGVRGQVASLQRSLQLKDDLLLALRARAFEGEL